MKPLHDTEFEDLRVFLKDIQVTIIKTESYNYNFITLNFIRRIIRVLGHSWMQ